MSNRRPIRRVIAIAVAVLVCLAGLGTWWVLSNPDIPVTIPWRYPYEEALPAAEAVAWQGCPKPEGDEIYLLDSVYLDSQGGQMPEGFVPVDAVWCANVTVSDTGRRPEFDLVNPDTGTGESENEVEYHSTNFDPLIKASATKHLFKAEMYPAGVVCSAQRMPLTPLVFLIDASGMAVRLSWPTITETCGSKQRIDLAALMKEAFGHFPEFEIY